MRKRIHQFIPMALAGLCLLWSASQIHAQGGGGGMGGGGGGIGGGGGGSTGGGGSSSSFGSSSGAGTSGTSTKSGGSSGSVGSTNTTYGGTNFLGRYYYTPQSYGLSGANGTSPTNGTSTGTSSSSGSGSSGGVSTGFGTSGSSGGGGSSSSSSTSTGFSGISAASAVKFGQAIYNVQPTSTFSSGLSTGSASIKSNARTLPASTVKPTYSTYVGFKADSAPVALVTGDFQRAVAESPDLSKPDNKLQLVLVGDVVVLRGVVQNEHDRILAETLAGTTPGVRGVRSELVVRDTTPLGMSSPR